MKRKCSMCGGYKDASMFRYMNTLKRYNCYCKECEKWYMKQYGRIRYEREKARKKMEQLIKRLNRKECKKAVEIISEYTFTNNEYTPTTHEAVEAIGLIDKLIIEHFELVAHTTPIKVLWTYDDEPLCPACHEVIDAGNQELCEFCGQRLDWGEDDEN